jgi:hypothetical protein
MIVPGAFASTCVVPALNSKMIAEVLIQEMFDV